MRPSCVWRCALLGGGNSAGQLGVGSTQNIGDDPGEMPPAEADLGPNPSYLFAGGAHVCGRSFNDVRCWGSNGAGQLGIGNTNSIGDQNNELPIVIDLGGNPESGRAGAGGTDFSCIIMDGGNLRCWGRNNHGQLGVSTPDSAFGDEPGEMPPSDVDLGGLIVKAVSAGAQHTCVVLEDESVRCWGDNFYAQLGNGTDIDILPADMPPPPVPLY